MFKVDNIVISKYLNKVAKENKDITVIEELMNIRDGKYKQEVEQCRYFLSLGEKSEYQKAKSNLPVVTFSGQFKDAHRAENLIYYSQLMVIDVDKIESIRLCPTKEIIAKDPHVIATWISPSNAGFKILFVTNSNPETHKIYFGEICEYLLLNYGIEADKSGSDICRLCFTSYDPLVIIKENATPFNVDISKATIKLISKTTTSKTVRTLDIEHNIDKKIDKILFFATEGKNSKKDRDTIDKLIKYLKVRKLSITVTYDDWYRVALAIANTFTYDLGKKYFLYLCQLDGINHDEYKSISLLEYCYRNRKINGINFATILYMAEQHGFVLKNKIS